MPTMNPRAAADLPADPAAGAAGEPSSAPSAPTAPTTPMRPRPLWKRALWGLAGGLSLLAGIVGIFLPLLPTTPFVLLAALCFSRSSRRCEMWLLSHRVFGPMVRDWRRDHAIPLRAKQLAWTMMALGSLWGALMLPPRWAWLLPACCAAVACWMWRLPTAPPRQAQPSVPQGDQSG